MHACMHAIHAFHVTCGPRLRTATLAQHAMSHAVATVAVDITHLPLFCTLHDGPAHHGHRGTCSEHHVLQQSGRTMVLQAQLAIVLEYDQTVVVIELCCAVLCLQRIRARAMLHFERAFQQCGVIVTPATPRTAPDLPDAVLHGSGTYDLAGTFETILFTQVIARVIQTTAELQRQMSSSIHRKTLCALHPRCNPPALLLPSCHARPVQAANLLGLPALVLPAGRVQEDGMPVGYVRLFALALHGQQRLRALALERDNFASARADGWS